jgi:hypothetical protein
VAEGGLWGARGAVSEAPQAPQAPQAKVREPMARILPMAQAWQAQGRNGSVSLNVNWP